MWFDIAYGFLVLVAGGLGGGLAAGILWYAWLVLRRRNPRNTVWKTETRPMGNQTWVVVRQIQKTWLGEVLLAEQPIAMIRNDAPNYAYEVKRKERLAELRAAWLNHGSPTTPPM